MKKNTTPSPSSADSKKSGLETTPDRLIDFRRVGELIGSRCRTAHTARAMAARGLIRAVRLNERVVRYSEASVRALVAGLVDPVAVPPRPTKENVAA